MQCTMGGAPSMLNLKVTEILENYMNIFVTNEHWSSPLPPTKKLKSDKALYSNCSVFRRSRKAVGPVYMYLNFVQSKILWLTFPAKYKCYEQINTKLSGNLMENFVKTWSIIILRLRQSYLLVGQFGQRWNISWTKRLVNNYHTRVDQSLALNFNWIMKH